jgi:hypothetical protein
VPRRHHPRSPSRVVLVAYSGDGVAEMTIEVAAVARFFVAARVALATTWGAFGILVPTGCIILRQSFHSSILKYFYPSFLQFILNPALTFQTVAYIDCCVWFDRVC